MIVSSAGEETVGLVLNEAVGFVFVVSHAIPSNSGYYDKRLGGAIAIENLEGSAENRGVAAGS